jgi:hypothetical protein
MRQQLHQITFWCVHVPRGTACSRICVPRGTRCAVWRESAASFQLQRNLAVDVAARPSRALFHNGVASTAQWQANFSARTVLDNPKRGTCVARRVFHVEHRGSHRGDNLFGNGLLRLPRFLKFSFAPCTSSTTTIVASTTVPVGGSQMLEPCFGTIDDQFRRKCRLNGDRDANASRVPRGTLLEVKLVSCSINRARFASSPLPSASFPTFLRQT